MNIAPEILPPSPEDDLMEPAAPKKGMGRTIFLALLLFVAILGLVRLGDEQIAPSSGVTGAVPAAPSTNVTARLDALEQRLAKLEEKAGVVAASTEVEGAKGPESSDLANLKTGLEGLSNALVLLQGQLNKSSETTNEVKASAQSGLAMVVAFMQMQEAARVGDGFEKERQQMRQLAGNDQELIDALMKLEKPALQGVPNAQALQKEWRALMGDAQAAQRKAGAQTWQDRLIVAIENLVSIRSLNPKPGDSLSLSAVEVDLSQGHVVAALEKVAAMPQDVQAVVQIWRTKAEMRRDLDRDIQSIAWHLMGKVPSAEPAPAAATPAPASVEPVTPAAAQPNGATP